LASTFTAKLLQKTVPFSTFGFRHQLRRTAANAVLFSVAEENAVEDKEFRRLMAKIVEQFVDDSHWENFFARGLSSHADGDYPNAIAMYSKARQSIQNDPNVCDELSWRQRVTEIETLEERAHSGNGSA
jgi:hypothetical protein